MKRRKLIEAKIAILMDARDIILKRERRGLCAAIGIVMALKNPALKNHRLDVLEAGNKLRAYIREVLGEHTYLEDWCATYNFRKYRDDARGPRLKWIDRMINCLNEDLAEMERAKNEHAH